MRGTNVREVDTEIRSGEAFAAASGIEICYDTFGDPAGRPLLLIMGLASQMILWNEDFCGALARQGRYVIRFDNRDIGRSTILPDAGTPSMIAIMGGLTIGRTLKGPYALADMAQDALGLLDALGIERADIVGASMGGAIACELAHAAPQRVRSLTLIMTPTGDPGSPQPTARALANLVQRPKFEREPWVRAYVDTWHVLAADHFPFDAERTRREGEASFDRGIHPLGVSRQLLALLASGNRKRWLGTLHIPTAVVHGTLDPLVPFPIGVDLARAIAAARFVPIEGMGHSLPREAWPEILGAIDAVAS
jgi:pimeloyl-ACP methyl ester carboxylesterase